MPTHAPRTELATHDVTNQPGELADVNLYAIDPALRDAVLREAGEWLDAPMLALGEEMGREAVLALGVAANRSPPELVTFDRFGRRIDEVAFHPAYHDLMRIAMDHGIHDRAWTTSEPGAHVAHFAMLALFTEVEAGVMCPISMTYSAVASLRRHAGPGAEWVQRILGGRYDAPLGPAEAKRGVTLGMAMTEKQGGSDVRANTTRAEPADDGTGAWRLTGHKWFCSAPMSDAFLTLAQTDGGLSCFLVPRILPDGSRNAIHQMRLKDKLGNKSNASSEIEYHGAHGWLIGDEGRGVPVIIDMVHHTRLGTVAGTVGIMRMALAQALHHTAGRRVFQRALIDQPMMRAVLADLIVEYEAAVALSARVARAFGGSGDADRAFARLAVALAKFWLTKRNPGFVFECMECHGGAGYVEEGPMPRLFRESPLNAIWEGSGNVIALDVLRTLSREPLALAAYWQVVDEGAGRDGRLDAAIAALRDRLSAGGPNEQAGRGLVETMALVLQGALLTACGPAAVADAFCATRLGAHRAASYGVLPDGVDVDAIVARHGAVGASRATV